MFAFLLFIDCVCLLTACLPGLENVVGHGAHEEAGQLYGFCPYPGVQRSVERETDFPREDQDVFFFLRPSFS